MATTSANWTLCTSSTAPKHFD